MAGNRNRGRSWNRSQPGAPPRNRPGNQRRRQRGWQRGNRPAGQRPRRSLVSRLLRNRYDPQSSWVSVGDLISNAKEIFYGWSARVPRGSRILWRNGKIVGHTTSFRAGPR